MQTMKRPVQAARVFVSSTADYRPPVDIIHYLTQTQIICLCPVAVAVLTAI